MRAAGRRCGDDDGTHGDQGSGQTVHERALDAVGEGRAPGPELVGDVEAGGCRVAYGFGRVGGEPVDRVGQEER
ncbi:hypothetical protein P1P68_05015 [Streptomyces scabiei]|uniref:hypothetical protein n=1 Tax=Streptomyces scabiei TaxID=1930 RepID=UPI0029902CBE|nr:hypothetical protein [Streptomyces scabiei]MDW8804168.1 hypothetical protein [Streptomyces scabiei]